MARVPNSSPQTLRVFEALLGDPETWRYGYDLSRETGLFSGTLYPVLMRLTDQALLEARWEPSDRAGRPPRHVYRLSRHRAPRWPGSGWPSGAAARLPGRRRPASPTARACRMAGWAHDPAGTDGADPIQRARGRLAGVAVAALAVLAVSPFLVTVQHLGSDAMLPTLSGGDRVVVDRLTHRLTGLSPGDLVLLDRRERNQPRYAAVTRVIGLPGDRMDCHAGRVHRNGTPVREPYLAAGVGTDCGPVTVPAGQLYVLGDVRSLARDSRHYGPVPADEVTGRVASRLWRGRGVNRDQNRGRRRDAGSDGAVHQRAGRSGL